MILEKVLATIRRHAMVVPEDRVLVAVSGGPDSVALLHLLLDLRTVLPLSLIVAHLDHALRDAESQEDRDFVERLCRRLGLECVADRDDVAILARRERRSIEEAGRTARRRFLRRLAQQNMCRRVAFGHQQDDQAESVLLRLVAGSGRGGLSGIKPVSEGLFVRPLLECGRSEILRYLEDRGIEFRTDSSNADRRFPRNRMRHLVLPLLVQEFNPRVVEAVARTADVLREEDAFLDRTARRILRGLAEPAEPGAGGFPGGSAEPGIVLDAPALAHLVPAIGRRVVRLALRHAGLRGRDLAKARIDDVLHLAGRGETNLSLSVGESFVARLEYGRLILKPGRGEGRDEAGRTPSSALEDGLRVNAGIPARAGDSQARARRGPPRSSSDTEGGGLPSPGVPLPIPGSAAVAHLGLILSSRIVPFESVAGEYGCAPSNRAYLDADLLETPLLVRAARAGDRFRPLGAPGTRKLSDLWTDVRLPHESRRRCLLVESAGRIAWAVGLRPSHPFRVTDRTRRVAVLESHVASNNGLGHQDASSPPESFMAPSAGPGMGRADASGRKPAADRQTEGPLQDPASPLETPSNRPVLYTPGQIADAVGRIAREVMEWAGGRELVLLGVLHGSFIFLSDLVRRLPGPIRVGFLDREGGLVTRDLVLEGARVLVVEDILDTGESLIRVLARVREHNPAEIRTCALFEKVHATRAAPLDLDYRGLPVPDLWVVGYGLDQDGHERNLPYLSHI